MKLPNPSDWAVDSGTQERPCILCSDKETKDWIVEVIGIWTSGTEKPNVAALIRTLREKHHGLGRTKIENHLRDHLGYEFKATRP